MIRKSTFTYLILTVLVSVLSSCSTVDNDASIVINLGSSDRSAFNSNLSATDNLFNMFSSRAVPVDVASLVITLTGTGMTPVEETFPADVSTILLKVIPGEARSLKIEAKNSSDITLYVGHFGPVNLSRGQTVYADITMSYASWGTIYVANQGSNTVSIIDYESNSVIDTITVGGTPFGVGTNSSTNRIYVANNADDTVSVIDGSDNTVIGSAISVCASSCEPIGVAVNQVTNKIYVGTQYKTGDIVVMIDGVTNLTTDISLGDCYPYGLDVNTVTNKVYASLWCGSLSIINGSTDTESSSLDMGLTDPFDSAVNETTNKIYVTQNGNDTVSVINGSTDALLSGTGYPIAVGGEPYGVDVNPVTNKIYVANNADNNVSVIDGSTDAVLYTITVGTAPIGVAINSVINRVYVTNSGAGTVSIIDGSTDTVIDTVTVGTNPAFIDVMD